MRGHRACSLSGVAEAEQDEHLRACRRPGRRPAADIDGPEARKQQRERRGADAPGHYHYPSRPGGQRLQVEAVAEGTENPHRLPGAKRTQFPRALSHRSDQERRQTPPLPERPRAHGPESTGSPGLEEGRTGPGARPATR